MKYLEFNITGLLKYVFKVGFCSKLTNFLNKYYKKLAYIIIKNYIKIKASYKEFCVELVRKNNTTLVFLLSNCPQVLKSFMTDPLNIIFDNFWIWLLGYRIELSCLNILKAYYFMNTLWKWNTDEYCVFLVLSESAPLTHKNCIQSCVETHEWFPILTGKRTIWSSS